MGPGSALALLACPGRRKLFATLLSNSRCASAFSRHGLPEVCMNVCPLEKRGSRECRVRAAPAVSCARLCEECAHEHTGSAETLRHPPRNGFTAYAVLSPATNSSCHRRCRLDGCSIRLDRISHRQLDTSNGCQNHTVLPYASAPFVLRAVNRSRETRPAITLRADAAASTASSPAFRDDRDTPLLQGKDGAS
jgi:hypothetical protein